MANWHPALRESRKEQSPVLPHYKQKRKSQMQKSKIVLSALSLGSAGRRPLRAARIFIIVV